MEKIQIGYCFNYEDVLKVNFIENNSLKKIMIETWPYSKKLIVNNVGAFLLNKRKTF